MLRPHHAPERGSSLVEYGAVILLVAGIVATVALTNVPAKVGGMFSHGMDCILRLGECERPDGGSGPQAAPGEDDGTPSDRRVVAPPDGNAIPPENADLPEENGRPENADLPASTGPADEEVVVEPVVFGWFDGDDPGLVPDPETKPDEVNDWWEGLSEAEREEVMREEPENIRGLDGVPAEVRNELNREFLDAEVERMLEEEGLTPDEALEFTLEEVRDDPVPGAPSLELWEMLKLQRTVSAEGSDHYILTLDPDEGRAIVSTGNPDTADNVATLVPGTGIEWTAINGQLGRAQNLREAAARVDEEADHAVVSWIGYDSPNWGQAPFGGKAEDGKDDLQDFQYGLRVTHEGEPSNNTLIGHSYGSVVVGHAARNDSGVYVDNIILVGSPGIGGTVDELNFDGDIEDVHVAMSDEDWINQNALKGFHDYDELYDGLEDSGASRIETGPETEHDGYFNQEEDEESGEKVDTTELRQFGGIIAGAE
ncbi:alpha/beta hydrolase [Nocardiopsis potens]|uniref:alpha/beta hydrolase n=1 Tax=Nocardiopsis potens TaxID=1246458 RepID=UPI00034515A8|nr:alpha/beta hydrolase [Nocardiopsis potens]